MKITIVSSCDKRLKKVITEQKPTTRRANCSVSKVEVDKELKDKKIGKRKIKKPVEITTTTRTCDLIQAEKNTTPPQDNKICVNKQSFDLIMKKIEKNLTEETGSKNESDLERKTRIFGDAWKELNQLSRGIMEEDEITEKKKTQKKKKKEPKYKGCKGNFRHRSKDTAAGRAGTFMSNDDIEKGRKGSASYWYSCRDKLGRVGLRGKKHRWIKDPDKCGRSSKDNPRRKCSDFKEEQGIIPEAVRTRWEELINY